MYVNIANVMVSSKNWIDGVVCVSKTMEDPDDEGLVE